MKIFETPETETPAGECACGECLECGERLSLLRVLLHPGSCVCSHCEARRAVGSVPARAPAEQGLS